MSEGPEPSERIDGGKAWKPRRPASRTGLTISISLTEDEARKLSAPGDGAGGRGWRLLRSSADALLPCVRLVGDFRVLGCIAVAMLLICALAVTVDDRPAEAGKRRAPAAASGESPRDEPSARPGPETLPAASTPRLEKASGDFFADLQLAFLGGSETALVQLPDSGEEGLFESWREILAPDHSISGLLFRKIKKAPDGGDIYQIIDDSARITGFIAIRLIEGRWRVVGARHVLEGGPKGADPKLLELIEGIRGRGGEDRDGPSAGRSGSIEDRGGLSPRKVERP